MIAIWLTAWISAGVTEELPEGKADSSATPSAASLLAGVRARLPRETLTLKGQLMCAGRIGRLEPAFQIEALLAWGQNPPAAQYTLKDNFGAPLARLSLRRSPERAPEITFEQGSPLKPAPTPDLNQPLANTDLTWNDLSFSFLWWADGAVVGRDNLRGRDCWVVEVRPPPGKPPAASRGPPPGGAPGAEGAFDPLASARLWIDDQLVVLIQIEGYNAGGQLMRRLSVKNFKKIGELWMVKNMDIRRYPSQHRTQIRIAEIISAAASNVLAESDEPAAAPGAPDDQTGE